MTKLKSTLIKLCSFVFAVCAAFAIATIPQAKTVDASGSASFKVNGASIYKYDGEDDGKIGLRFEAEFNDAWLTANTADTYTFGMIVAPTANFEAAEAEGAEKPWSKDNTPTINMKAVDGINFIRIKNKAVDEGQIIYANILFDDDSLKAAIAEYKGVEATTIKQSEVDALRANFYNQSYTAVAYASYGSKVIYSEEFATTMRETAAKTYAVGVAEGNADYKALALTYLQLTDADVYAQTAYVLASDNKVVVDSAENYEAKESTMIVADGKVLKLGTDYTLVDGDIVLTEAKASKTVETVVVIDDTMLNVVEVTYTDVALSNAQEVAEYFALDDGAESNNLSAVLAKDIDMAGIILSNYKSFNYTGSFDGRGHVLSNVTLDLKNGDTDNTTYGLFGNVKSGAVIKNVAFSDIRSVDHQASSAVFGYSFEGSLENVYVSYSVDNKSTSGLFVKVEKGTMKNVVIVDNYDNSAFDKDTYIETYKHAWGVSPISRLLGANSSTFENVQVISRRPINYYSKGSDTDVTYNAPVVDDPATEGVDETAPATVNDWGTYYAYAENETELWYDDFDYFYRSATDEAKPGLGLEGAANVANTSGTGKTIVKDGIRRYNDMSAFLADADNATNREKLLATGFWKDVEGDIVWANNANISEQGEYVDEVDYDASTGILYSTAWNGEKVSYVILDGAVLTAEENGGLVLDGENNIVGVRAKVNADDPNAGIDYRTNGNSSKVINYEGKLSICVNNKVYNIRKVNYYTQLIFDVTDLKEAVGYDVNYKVDTYTADTATDREAALNGKGYFVATTKSGSNYYEGVYNAGIYKMMANLDMEKAGIGYTNNPLVSSSEIGGFVGYFDGNGYTIANFKPEAQGLFGRVGTYVAGNVVAGTNVTAGQRYVNCKPVIKNLALTEVITTYYDAPNFYATPILANLLGTNTNAASPHTTTVENIYVTVSTTDSTAPGSLVVHLGGHTKMNNVYIENQNEFNMVEVDGKFYRMTDDPSRPTVENGTKVWNVMKNWKESREGVLFGWAYSDLGKAPGNDDIATGTLDNTTNTYVVSTMPINFSTKSSMFMYAYSATYTGIKFSAENGIEFNNDSIYKLGKINKDKTNVYVAVAYAANEEVGNILIPYGFKQSAIDDVKYILSPVTEDSETTGLGLTSIGSYGGSAFMCNKCGEIAFSVTGRTVGENGACLLGCGGKYVDTQNYKVKNSANSSGTGPFASPCVYEFTVHTAADMGTKYDHTNGAFKLKGVKKYADVEAMKKANNDYSSFTDETGNGLWEVIETDDGNGGTLKELKWVGNTKKVA